MKIIKQSIVAILIACTASMPAWGMFQAFLAQNYLMPKKLTQKPQGLSAELPQGFALFNAEYDQEVREIFMSAFNYVPSLYTRIVIAKDDKMRVWREKDHIAAALIFQKTSLTSTYIEYLGVHERAQRKGIGAQMLDGLEKELAAECPSSSCRIQLFSACSAVGFYEKNGFTCTRLNECSKEFTSTMSDLKLGSKA